MYAIILTTAFGTTFKAQTVRGLNRALRLAVQYLAAGFAGYRVRRVA